jgi:cell division transport system permease protein
MWTKLKRVFKSGFVGFWRNGVVSAASILTLTVTLVVIGSLILASAYLNASLETVKNNVDISVSFKTDASENEVLSLKNTLASLSEVKVVEYISRDQELADFRERHKDNALLIKSLDEVGNPFGARLNIKAKDPSQYESIARFLNSSAENSTLNRDIIDQTTFKKDIVDRLVTLIATIKKIGFAISMILIFMSILVTFNTLSLAIYTSREEISVMKLVGASDNYVSGPFVIEGIIAGVISVFISIGLLYPLVLWIKSATEGVYGGINMVAYYIDNFVEIFLILLLAGIGLGIIASLLAIRRYLK